ncbi:hypothetical protein CDV31_011092 [Fusarium ambrosium]|uniref:Uncharacterized protein n=1 Tax=Fusarium ambrosium TaxID=131363 RepID=A0A428TJ24_9HYPO|nr:hypothetical protein CDV31_011092 [Fusarium ambrosium]
MKRKSSDGQPPNSRATLPNKRPRNSQPSIPTQDKPVRFYDGRSAQHEAEDYRLATAKMPLDVLSCVWRKGTNRHLNSRHVEKLCNIFKQGDLKRQDAENCLLVQCSAKAVSRMMSHLGQLGRHSQCNQVLSFEDWLVVNPNEKAEVMAGQHRIEALHRIPAEMDVKLRVNRRDLSLPDSHGQIWMQLVLANDQCDSLFQGKKYDVEKRMMDILRLRATEKFPTARLATLWKNNRWRSMITRWCETRLGRTTFNISTWDWMASYRIDSASLLYWFTIFEQALESLSELPKECVYSLQASDWAKLAEALPNGHTEMEVRRLFYPSQPSDEFNLTRRQGLLSELNDDAYTRVYRRIVDRPRLVFPDVQKLLKTTKEEGRIMMQVLTHVVAWLNPSPTVIIDKRQNNKPLIREDLKPAIWQIQAASQLGDGNNNSELNSGTIWKEGQSTQLETLSIQLEKAVLDAVRDHMHLFKSVAIKNSLSILPDDDKDGYQERFANEPWKKVLDKVEEIIGPVFESSLLPATFPTTRDDTDNDQPMSKITREICARVLEIPKVARDAALQCPEAGHYGGLITNMEILVTQRSLMRDGILSKIPRRHTNHNEL